jgi:uncharacterized protein
MDLLKVGDVKEFRIIGLDATRKRISLSLKPQAAQQQQQQQPHAAQATHEARTAQKAPRERRPESRESADGTVYNPFADLLRKKKE